MAPVVRVCREARAFLAQRTSQTTKANYAPHLLGQRRRLLHRKMRHYRLISILYVPKYNLVRCKTVQQKVVPLIYHNFDRGIATMQRVFHGGHCCGMTTIFGFGSTAALLPATVKKTRSELIAEGLHAAYPDDPFPSESQEDRLKRLIYLTENTRPSGIIEVVLVDQQVNGYDLPEYIKWGEVLKTLNFKLVNRHKNSNSGKFINVFHRNSGAEGVAKLSPPAVPAVATQPVAVPWARS